jgi:hypothetical protein
VSVELSPEAVEERAREFVYDQFREFGSVGIAALVFHDDETKLLIPEGSVEFLNFVDTAIDFTREHRGYAFALTHQYTEDSFATIIIGHHEPGGNRTITVTPEELN